MARINGRSYCRPAMIATSVGALFVAAGLSAAATATLTSSADNTLYQDASGLLSNGAGTGMFVGMPGAGAGGIRRALIRWDLSSLPAGAVITGATITLRASQVSSSASVDVSLHNALAAWGEGTSLAAGGGGSGAPSTAGDATWLHTFYNASFWTTPGGDFEAAALAVTPVGAVGTYSWSSPGLAAQAQAWLNSPAANFGIVLTGLESGSSTAKRFDTHEVATPATRPTLTISYDLPAPGTGTAGFLAGWTCIRRRRR